MRKLTVPEASVSAMRADVVLENVPLFCISRKNSSRLCVCVCVYVYVCVCVCVCACLGACVCANTGLENVPLFCISLKHFSRLCVWECVYNVCVCVCVCVYMHVCVCVYMCMCVCICTYMIHFSRTPCKHYLSGNAGSVLKCIARCCRVLQLVEFAAGTSLSPPTTSKSRRIQGREGGGEEGGEGNRTKKRKCILHVIFLLYLQMSVGMHAYLTT